jgi:hypothetical protein
MANMTPQHMNPQQVATSFINANPAAAVVVRRLLEEVTPSQLITVTWSQIKLGVTYHLSPSVAVLGQALKEAIPDLIRSKSAEVGESRHGSGQPWHLTFKGASFILKVSLSTVKGGANGTDWRCAPPAKKKARLNCTPPPTLTLSAFTGHVAAAQTCGAALVGQAKLLDEQTVTLQAQLVESLSRVEATQQEVALQEKKLEEGQATLLNLGKQLVNVKGQIRFAKSATVPAASNAHPNTAPPIEMLPMIIAMDEDAKIAVEAELEKDCKKARVLKPGDQDHCMPTNPDCPKTTSYDCGVYFAIRLNFFLASIWLMPFARALEWLAEQSFTGTAIDIFNKILIFKIGAGRAGPAYLNGPLKDSLGGYGQHHREETLTTAHAQVVRRALEAKDGSGEDAWAHADDRRLMNIGPMTKVIHLGSVHLSDKMTFSNNAPVALKGTADKKAVEGLVREDTIRSSSLPSLAGRHPMVMNLPHPDDAPKLAAPLESAGIRAECLGSNASDLIGPNERVCDFVGRMLGKFYGSVKNVVERESFKNGEVIRWHRTDMLIDNDSANYELYVTGLSGKSNLVRSQQRFEFPTDTFPTARPTEPAQGREAASLLHREPRGKQRGKQRTASNASNARQATHAAAIGSNARCAMPPELNALHPSCKEQTTAVSISFFLFLIQNSAPTAIASPTAAAAAAVWNAAAPRAAVALFRKKHFITSQLNTE